MPVAHGTETDRVRSGAGRVRLRVAAAGIAGLVAVSAGAGYQAQLSDSSWRSVSGASACHLLHTVPRFGTVVLSQYEDLTFAATVLTRRPPSGAREGRLYRVDAPWKGQNHRAIRSVSATPGLNTVTLDGPAARRVVRGLEAGYYMSLRFPEWAGGSLRAELSPVRFRPALRSHLECMAGFTDGEAPSSGDRGQAGAQAGASTTAGTLVPTASDGGDTAGDTAADAGGGNGGSADRDKAGDGALPELAPVVLYFAHDNANVDKTDLDGIRAVAERLRGGAYWSRITITGHADSRGNPAYNRALGLARAIEVRNRLINLGVSGDRVAVATRGEATPAGDNDEAYGRARNRRVTIRAEH